MFNSTNFPNGKTSDNETVCKSSHCVSFFLNLILTSHFFEAFVTLKIYLTYILLLVT